MTDNTIRTTAGAPWGSNQDSKTVGARGPLLLENYQLIEKLAHQNRERIPERTVHAKGSGAYGTFTVTKDITAYTRAAIFSEVGKKTELLARFSTVAGERGAADAERDVRGFSLKFYTDEETGIWWGTTRRSSSCVTRSSFLISFIPKSAIREPICVRRRQCGISGP